MAIHITKAALNCGVDLKQLSAVTRSALAIRYCEGCQAPFGTALKKNVDLINEELLIVCPNCVKPEKVSP